MSGFDNFNTDFYKSSYSVDDQNQGGYAYNNQDDPYNRYTCALQSFATLKPARSDGYII